MVSALAPGYVADTTTWGGAMLGYDSIPMFNTEMVPTRVIRMATTHAKMGRSIKKLGMSVDSLYCLPPAACPAAGGPCSPGFLFGSYGVALAGLPGCKV